MTVLAFLLLLLLAVPAVADEPPMFDLANEKVLYCVGYAHLDTQWRWDFTTTIDEYLRATLDDNFDRFENYPGYVFNFTGSIRYQMMKEYYPERYEKLKEYVAGGRWFVSGSSVDEGDVNVPSAEAVMRQVLYGNAFFRREFGKESVDFMLPDCFGFPASMPSIWAHAGLRGFSTQKLTWGSAVGIPFKVGVWEGPDGNSVIAALDPGAYVGAVDGRVDLNDKWVDRVETNGREYGVWADFHYYGVGDMGGAPRAEDVENYLASIDNPDSKIKVALTSSDQMFKDISDEMAERLPRYKGDMLLTEHSAGTLTSQSYMKRWNRKGELLADAAERVAVAGEWLGGITYPQDKLNRSWDRLLANQMHDILPGTSIPRAYTFSWNDEIVAQNGFAAVLTDAAGAVAQALDTEMEGTPLVVYNPLTIAREDVVEATVVFNTVAPESVQVYGPDGKPVLTQELDRHAKSIRLLFLARVPSVSLSTFEVRSEVREGTSSPDRQDAGAPSKRQVENDFYRVTLNDAGDVASIFDKKAQRELLREPARLVFTHERPRAWPAWNMDWADRQLEPLGYVDGPATIRVVENGPVRTSIEVVREARNSIVTQRIRLASGDAGRRVEFDTHIDWQSASVALRAAFPFTFGAPKATYNWGLGTIERGNNDPVKYEVPSHEWFDLTAADGKYGVAVLEDSKFGSDKPDDKTVRLTLLYSPGVRSGYKDQHSQDWGRHDMLYALYGHEGDWRDGRAEWQGRRLNQPLRVFQAAVRPILSERFTPRTPPPSSHEGAGARGRSFSWLSVSTPQVDVRALKKAEDGDLHHNGHYIVRLQELWGRAAEGVRVTLADGIVEAWETDGQERRISDAKLEDGELVVDLTPYSPKTFAVRLKAPPVRFKPFMSSPVDLAYDADVVSTDKNPGDGEFADGWAIPAEMLPSEIVSEGVVFKLGPTADGALNAVSASNEIIFPRWYRDRLYVLAAATEDADVPFHIDGGGYHDWSRAETFVPSWTGFVGQFDDRIWDREFPKVDYRGDGFVVGFKPGFIERTPIAWYATHRHHAENGNEAYRFSYLYKLEIPFPPGDGHALLTKDPRVKVLAVTTTTGGHAPLRPAAPLYDDFSDRGPLELRHVYPPRALPVWKDVEPVGTFTMDKKGVDEGGFDALSMGAPHADDAATGLVFRYHDSGREWLPNSGSGEVDGTLPRLNDGEVAQNDDDTSRCVWYDNAGRFSLDLGERQVIERVNTYSWHRQERAPQFFSLWGSASDEMPDAAFANGESQDWTLLAVVNTREQGQGGIQGSSVTGKDGRPLGTWRHLLWVSEDVGNGTFYTEIDVHLVK